MNLPHLVTSLELSKRLKELGCKQNSLFYWSDPIRKIKGSPSEDWQPRILQFDRDKESDKCDIYSAYTAGELEEMLPEKINGFIFRHEKFFDKNGYPRHSIGYYEIGHEDELRFEARYGDSTIETYARMLIYLLTSNLINVTK